MAESSRLHYHQSVRSKVLGHVRERGLMRAGDRVCVAVSGGADSVALLRILLALRAELGIVLAVAHFNHQLRGYDSEADEAFVADLARQHGLEFFASRADVRQHALVRKLSIEAAGRELRYEWLVGLAGEQRFDSIATAHTLDDQAETVLLKLLRGAGTRGLAGIYSSIEIENSKHFRPGSDRGDRQGPSREAASGFEPGAQAPGEWVSGRGPRSGGAIRIVRPLLSVTRDEVEAYLKAAGQSWRDDESNLEPRFARNRVRHELLPLLEREYNPNLRHVLRDSAELWCAEEDYWRALVERHLETRMRPLQFHLEGFGELPLALQRRLLRGFAETEGIALDFEHVERLLRCALGELARMELPGGWMATCRDDCLHLCVPEAPAASISYQYLLPLPGEVRITEIGCTLRATFVPESLAAESNQTGSLLAAELLGAGLTVRNWRPGDRFWPVHTGSEAKLKRLFAEKHIPAEQRPTWPVALSREAIVWVRGFPVARAFAWSGGDAVRIECLRES